MCDCRTCVGLLHLQMRDKRRNLLTFSNLSTSLPWKEKKKPISEAKLNLLNSYREMIGSDEVDPSHAQQIIMNKEVGSLTSWLRHVIFIPNSALITSCFSHYLLSVLKSKRVWQPLEIPISSITAHLRVTEGCGNWLERGKGEGGREHLRCHPVRGGIQRQKSFYARVRMWWEGSDLKGPTQQSCLKGGAPELQWRIFIWAGSSVIRLWCLSMSESTRPKNQTSTIPPEQLKCKLQETKKYIFCMWNLIIYWQLGFDDKW